MSVSDPIADMLTRIRMQIRKGLIMLSCLLWFKSRDSQDNYEEGYISSYEVVDGKTTNGILRIYLRYNRNKTGIISGLKRISKPGLRVYTEKDKIPCIPGRTGNCNSFTSGVMTAGKPESLVLAAK